MSKARIVIVIAFIVTFVAGTLVGMVCRTAAPKPPAPAATGLASELNLTPEQSEQMRAIWTGVWHSGGSSRERRDALRKEYEAKVRALLTDEQKAPYDALQQELMAKFDEISKDREKRFQDAVAKTKAILSSEQQTKYDEILKRRMNRGRAGTAADVRKAETVPTTTQPVSK